MPLEEMAGRRPFWVRLSRTAFLLTLAYRSSMFAAFCRLSSLTRAYPTLLSSFAARWSQTLAIELNGKTFRIQHIFTCMGLHFQPNRFERRLYIGFPPCFVDDCSVLAETLDSHIVVYRPLSSKQHLSPNRSTHTLISDHRYEECHELGRKSRSLEVFEEVSDSCSFSKKNQITVA